MQNFKEYLIAKGASKNTIQGRLSGVKDFENWLVLEEITLKKVDYETMMNYTMYCRKKANTVHTIRLKVNSLKHYFDYLIENKILKTNPAKLVELKGGTRKVPYGMLTSEDLQELYAHQGTYGLSQKRNKILLSLIVFQGLRRAELSRIELKDVDLMNGKIYIASSRSANERELELKPQQLLLFQDYMTKIRPDILKLSQQSSNYFLVHIGGSQNMDNVVTAVVQGLKPYFTKFKSLQQIRQSVITEWLKTHGLRKAQYMAGHRYVSSTERYDVHQIEGLKTAIKSHYVLKNN